MRGLETLADRKIDPSQQSLTLADCRRPDCPLIYVNKGFELMTGYTKAEAVGRNCRFLQGPDTDPEARAQIRAAVEDGSPLIVDLLNYHKDGTTFWNRLSLRPVRNQAGQLTHIVGIQSNITAMRDLEARLVDLALLLGGQARSDA